MANSQIGVTIVDKPSGITSHDVVSRVRRLAGIRKVGHAGTLDPMATGVLVLGINRATRLLGHLTLTDKTYQATIQLGATTTTDDAEGEVLQTRETDVLTPDQVEAALTGFVGEIDQVPSAVSAIKVDGQRAYKLARAGQEVNLSARRVQVHRIAVDRLELPAVEISVDCSSGTYIRAIARDLGVALGVGGHLSALRRTAVGSFSLDQARTLAELEAEFSIIPISAAARASFRSVDLDDTQAQQVRFGRRLDLELTGISAVFAPDGEFLALYEPIDSVQAWPVAVFV
ncbi:MAG TPA: tRNA pseudouridine(55) synthase TruB [Marmoricola sp.]|nr:tRNA pseudouridine(55) synthase TruB [Marmoricola sp.]